MPLNDYNKKRNFEITTEPKGVVSKKENQYNKFSVQEHHARNLHYDLRLEHKGVLISFAIPKKLSNKPNVKRLAINVEDHPLDYLTFEGVIPEGQYGAGSVILWDLGNYVSLNNFEKSYKNGNLKLVFNGNKLKGAFNLIKIKDDQWLIFKSKDKFSKNILPKKVKNPFKTVEAQLALLCDKIPKGEDYLFETKFDGYRIFAFIENNKIKLSTRNNKNYTKKFNSIEKSLKEHFKDQTLILDGEIIVAENGISNFSALQDSIKQNKGDFTYCIFDILALNGDDLRQNSLLIRKNLLKKSLKNAPENLLFSDYVIGNGQKMFNLAKKLGLEGVIAKKINSTYTGARNGDWLKIKCYHRQEFVVVGFTTTEKNTKLSAILLGYYKNNKLIYAGKVGTGFSNEQREDLSKIFKKYETPKSFLSEEIPSAEKITYLKPKLVAEIQFIELTNDNIIRQGSFVALRTDKLAKQVVLEYENE